MSKKAKASTPKTIHMVRSTPSHLWVGAGRVTLPGTVITEDKVVVITEVVDLTTVVGGKVTVEVVVLVTAGIVTAGIVVVTMFVTGGR